MLKVFELHQGDQGGKAPCRVILILWIKLKQRSHIGYFLIPVQGWNPSCHPKIWIMENNEHALADSCKTIGNQIQWT